MPDPIDVPALRRLRRTIEKYLPEPDCALTLRLLDELEAARARALPSDARERIERVLTGSGWMSESSAEIVAKDVLSALAPCAHDKLGPGGSCRKCGGS